MSEVDERGVAVWETEYREAVSGGGSHPAAPLSGPRTVDVAIVGGGFTGVSTAWHLRRRNPELGIALLEAHHLGHGASGRSGGQLLNGLNDWEEGSAEGLRRVYTATLAGIDLAEELSRYAAPGTFSRRGCLAAFTRDDRAANAAARVEALRRAGVPADYITGADVPVRGASGAIVDPGAGRLNGFALLQAMRDVLREAGVEIFEGTPVLRVRTGRSIALDTPGGELRAASLVIATNVETPALGFFRRRLLPVASHVLATEPLSESTWREIGWGEWDGFYDDMDRTAFASRTGSGRLLLGGGHNSAYGYRWRGRPLAPLTPGSRGDRAIRAALERYFPGVASLPIEHRWVGTLAVTLDRVCSMGVGGENRNVYHALGYSGHGAALSLLAGRVLADLHAGDEQAWRDQPFFQKRLPPLPPEPLRWLGYHVWTRITGHSPRRQLRNPP